MKTTRMLSILLTGSSRIRCDRRRRAGNQSGMGKDEVPRRGVGGRWPTAMNMSGQSVLLAGSGGTSLMERWTPTPPRVVRM